MGLENVKSGKLLYHLTELKNLESIIRFGLIPRKVLLENTVTFEDIANPEIIVKRERLGLDEYIPFHFHPYTAFDLAVKKQHANDEMMYICIRRELARRNNFKVLPKHPLSLEDCQLYDYEEGFKRIDWDTMAKVGLTDPDSKQTKMAECLSAKVIPVDCFQCFYVPSEQSKEFAENTLRAYGIEFPPPFVNVMPQWF
ncbi:MAG TPA: DUF4433 domain-containing protein [Candidatus Enterocloster excrementipullorum]|uniref:DUF4433 domain-containing protein n=1 Tax=Candidatus Enterocloster excrementipullorum TaxID=2838559 RepID=A0A9D2SIY4_9FIRM|nr:DUF4433 domain-containing protein [Candidatus Enterocloster excrementipullorum]